MRTLADAKAFLFRRETVAILLLALLAFLFTLTANASARDPISSAETKFVEHSTGGMQIVPASCPSNPSNPDYPHNTCSGATPSCSIYFSPSVVANGSGSNVFWNASGAGTLSYPSGSQGVGASGSLGVTGDQTKTYTFSGTDLSANSPTPYSCSATLTVCAAGQTVSNGQCVNPPNQCPAGQVMVNGVCQPGFSCPSGQHDPGNRSCVCDSTNQLPVNGSCATCPTGQHAVGAICICDDTNAPPDSSGRCTMQVCPAGFQYDSVTGQCVAVQQCQQAPICSDSTHVLNQCTGQTIDCVAQNGQGWFCSGGICRPPPPPIASISVVPSLIRRGDTVNVAWTSSNTASCTVTGNNGDGGVGWSGKNGTHTSSPIQNQVIFTLSCEGLNGADITRTAAVNIIPIEEETCSVGFHHEGGQCIPD